MNQQTALRIDELARERREYLLAIQDARREIRIIDDLIFNLAIHSASSEDLPEIIKILDSPL